MIQRPLSFVSRSKLHTISSLLVLVVFFGLSAVPVLAQSAQPTDFGLGYGSLTPLGTQDIRVSIMQVINVILGFLGIIALVLCLYAGYLWMTAAGNEDKIAQAKQILRNALIGLIIIFSAFAIVQFLINSLTGATGSGGSGGGGNPACDGCGYLGGGIIQSVYPIPGATNVPRNTNVVVTFKTTMNAATVIVGCQQLPCEGELDTASVILEEDRPNATPITNVGVATTDGKTYVFNPRDYLGSGLSDQIFRVTLTDDIEKANGDSAFAGVNDSFRWRFEVDTLLDLDPVEQSSVFPQPDNLADIYAEQVGVQASAVLALTTQPSVGQQASFESAAPSLTNGQPGVVAAGSSGYVGPYTGALLVTVTQGSTASVTYNDSLVSTITFGQDQSGSRTAVIGFGLQLTVQSADVVQGSQWRVAVQASRQPDTATFAGKRYTFVASTNPGADQIAVGSTIAQTAQSIATVISGGSITAQPIFSSVGTGAGTNAVAVRARLAGAAGNLIRMEVSSIAGTWAQLCLTPTGGCVAGTSIQLSGGTDPAMGAQTQGVADKPRNAVIKVNFNEPVNPLYIDPEIVRVEYFNDTQTPLQVPLTATGVSDDLRNSTNWTRVAGQHSLGSQYQTVDFLTGTQCGACSNDGLPCATTSDCSGGAVCNKITNACGDPVYCLPVLADSNTAVEGYNPTLYRVIAKAGKLKQCATNQDCIDPNFNQCVEGYCQSNEGVRYPEADQNPLGVIDIASNSYNSNLNTHQVNAYTLGRAEGPEDQSGSAPYVLNLSDAVQQGDDLAWYFYVNRSIKLQPPVVTKVSPIVEDSGISLTSPASSTFDILMMSSTLKPGTGYEDGLCRCARANEADLRGTCASGYYCDLPDGVQAPSTFGKCRIENGEQTFCSADEDCPAYQGNASMCINKKYVSLVDTATVPVGWWITSRDVDATAPLDGFTDISETYINHTRFAEITNYGGELGSGVQDIYQNCYLPSKGPVQVTCDPSTDVNCCPVTATQPFCCNGRALSRQAWESSECYTGY